MKQTAAFTACCLLVFTANAAETNLPLTLVVDNMGKRALVSPKQNQDYTYEQELGEEIKGITLKAKDFPEGIEKIEFRYTTSTAIGLEGPWYDIPSLSRTSEWITVPFPQNQPEFTIAIPSEEQVPALKKASADVVRREALREVSKKDPYWLDAAKKCDGKADYNPCYDYHSVSYYRITTRDNRGVINLMINYPGGC